MTYPPHCQYFSRRTHKPLSDVRSSCFWEERPEKRLRPLAVRHVRLFRCGRSTTLSFVAVGSGGSAEPITAGFLLGARQRRRLWLCWNFCRFLSSSCFGASLPRFQSPGGVFTPECRRRLFSVIVHVRWD